MHHMKPETSGHSSSESDMSAVTALKAAKKELRGLMKTKLSSISKPSLDDQSLALYNALAIFPAYTSASRVSVYLSMPSSEIQTDLIVRSALSSGKTVFIPYLHKNTRHPVNSLQPKKVMDMVSLKGLEDYEGLKRDSWGIPTVSEEGLDGRERILEGNVSGKGLHLMLLPGVAFQKDAEGEIRRLGHGRGFYDFFLERYREAYEKTGGRKIELYGIALKEQVLGVGDQTVPVGDLDSPLHGLVVGDGSIIESSKRS